MAQVKNSRTQAVSFASPGKELDDSGWDTTVIISPAKAPTPWKIDPAGGSQSMLRMEVTFNSFTPQLTGGTASLNVRIIAPNSDNSDPTYGYNCYFDNATISIKGDQQNFYTDKKIDNVKFPIGSQNEYPFDSYENFLAIYCQYTNANPATPTDDHMLQFTLAIDKNNVGLFQQRSTVTQPSVLPGNDFATNQGDFTYFLPYWDNTVSRATINRVFPVYLFCAIWAIVIAQTFIFIPLYIGKKTVDNQSMPLGAVGILFALPNIRNQMPGAPPVGALFDFAGYFWCLIIAIIHFLCISVMYFRVAAILPPHPKKKD